MGEVRACRLCRDTPAFSPALPHEPRPVFQAGRGARILIASQAPGVRAHVSGRPFDDPSGVRLREWTGLSWTDFYDASKILILPMGFCFPGHTPDRGDLPPRRECRAHWHPAIFDVLPAPKLVLAIGRYAQAYHFRRLGHVLPPDFKLEDLVRRGLTAGESPGGVIALPHPSWRNSAWLKKNPWFEAGILPALRRAVAEALG